MGGIEFILILVIIVGLIAAVFGFFALRSATRQGHRLRARQDHGRPLYDAPHPEQAERERGTLFPPASA
jgi:flagellar basal body-associated protein FliL